jgi:hypothetical protein
MTASCLRLNPCSVWVWVWVLYYDRQSVGQSVLVSSTHLGLTTRFLLLSDSCGFVDVRRSLWREDGSVVYYCSWSSSAQLFSGPRHVGLVTIFYCLRFETSLFVASYDSQGYGGGIRPRLHTGFLLSLANSSPFITSTRPEYKSSYRTVNYPLLLSWFSWECLC